MELAGRTLTIETGLLAIQAHGAVTVQAGDTMCLVTACCGEKPSTAGFFPLTVDYEERLYAAGKIPGSFFRREGRPTEKAILTSRMVDRGIRPLFPEGLRTDVQIIITALSADKENQIDILAMIGASAALAISGIPFPTPVASMRVAYVDGEWQVYPTHAQSEAAELDLTITATREHITMIEAAANEASEALIADGCRLAHREIVRILDLIEDLRAGVNPTERVMPLFIPGDDVWAAVEEIGAKERLAALFSVEGFFEQKQATRATQDELMAALLEKLGEERKSECAEALDKLFKKVVRTKLLDEGVRLDGRNSKQLRELTATVGIAPRTHGSGLFRRGQTQALNLATLGMLGDSQKMDGLVDEDARTFLHHYNMPPFSNGEAYFLRGPSRRSIGHGALAEKALRPVLPSIDDFPYTIRLVTEILSSNGSTSMASVCSGSLAMMDAGIPIRAAVGGIAMGIIYDSPSRYCVLTDIQGAEDHNGDMDFKVAGTRAGITALQLDVKAQGLTPEILEEAMLQAREARMEILDVMDGAIAEPRPELSPFAPRVLSIDIDTDKIGTVIGPSGKTIRKIEELGVSVEVQETGRILIGAVDSEAGQKALQFVRDLVREPKPGELFEKARVTRLMPFGAFCEILPGREGLLHVSEYSWEHVNEISDVLSVGDILSVQLKEVDSQGRLNLTRRALLEKPEGYVERPRAPRREGGREGGDRGGRGGPRGGGSGGSRRGGGGGGGGREGGDVRFRDKRS